MARSLTFYHSPTCEACDYWEPLARSYARQKGLRFKRVDVDKCNTDQCNDMAFTPTVHVNGRELPLERLEK